MTQSSASVEPAAEHDSFLRHPVVEAYVALRIWGRVVAHLDVVAAEIRSRTEPGARVVALTHRGVDRELELARRLPDRQFEVVSLAPGPVADAAREAAAAGGIENLTLRPCSTLAEVTLPPHGHDVALALYTAHLCADLETYWDTCRAALRPGGILLAQEYVGPDRFAWPAPQVEAANRALDQLVPPAHKRHHEAVTPALAADLTAAHPHLAIRSTDIVSTCVERGFELVAQVGAACALLHPVLTRQIESYHPTDWEHNHVLSALFREEARLMAGGTLGDDFAMFIAAAPS